MSDTCATCRFYFSANKDQGECRRRIALSGDDRFYSTYPDLWCGEHEPKRGDARDENPNDLLVYQRLAKARYEQLDLALARAEKAEAEVIEAHAKYADLRDRNEKTIESLRARVAVLERVLKAADPCADYLRWSEMGGIANDLKALDAAICAAKEQS
jgi:hypothetical protein